MKFKALASLLGVALLATACADKLTVASTPDGSSEPGYEKGVSGAYTAVVGDVPVLIGGCNFPETPVAEGGTKRFYEGVYAYEGGAWALVGKMPQSMAYGVCVAHGGKAILVGGANENGSLSTVYAVDIKNFSIDSLASLPFGVDNAAGAIMGDKLLVVGGNQGGKASNKVLSLDLACDSAQWEVVDSIPGLPRVQPACSVSEGKLLVMAGFAPATDDQEATTHTDGYLYDFQSKTWTHVDAPKDANGEELTYSGGVAAYIAGADVHVLLGGVNKDIFTDAISGRYELVEKDKYLLKEPEWYKFNRQISAYDDKTAQWVALDVDEQYARAGASLAVAGTTLYYMGGELKPGIRIPNFLKIDVLQLIKK